jgi:hypothetical protein
MTRCSAANSSMRAVTSIDAAVFSGVPHRPTADPVQHADLREYGRTRIGQSQPVAPARMRGDRHHTSPPGLHGLRLPRVGNNRPACVRGVSILERLAGLRDDLLQSFTQKPQSRRHREMTVADGTASEQDSPISATVRTDERPPHAAAHPRRPRARVRACGASAPRSSSMRALHGSRMSSCGVRAFFMPLRPHRPIRPARRRIVSILSTCPLRPNR